jgi:myo-inositol 2-dehydrogenase / D-chiro-inositol 1-dehydrogenase
MIMNLSRRSFLRQTVSGSVILLGAPVFAPSSVLGLDGTVAPSNRITVGFIGTGRQAIYANIPGFLQEPDAQALAVCDVDSWRMGKAARQIDEHHQKRGSGSSNGCTQIGDWRELLARRDIDAVMISTPDHWHVPIALAAIRAGKDVACEKPLTRNIAEGRTLADLVTKSGRVFRTDSEFRSNRTFHRAAELVRNGKIGKLLRIISGTPKDSTLPMQPEMPVPAELNFDMWLGPAPETSYTEKRVHPRHDDKGRPGWLCIRAYADGMLANWGAHLNDIAMWANNTEHTGPVEIEAKGSFPNKGNLWDVVQEFEAHFLFANGVRLTCKTDSAYLRFEGTEGTIHIVYPNQIETQPESLLSWKPGPNDLVLPFKTSEKRDFLDSVKTRKQPLYDCEAGHRNTSLSHLAIAAIEVGRKIKWDPVNERVIADEAATRALMPKSGRKKWS